MNVKIKSSGVSCLVGDDYDRVYAALKKQFGEDEGQLFTERIPGHEYLQWELPGDGWTQLSEGDPMMAQEVRNELFARKKSFSQRFGNNQEMAQRILSVPDDSYVYYKADANGRLLIRLTAWGYRYPERIGTGTTTGVYTPKDKTEHVRICVIYDNKPLGNKTLFVNGFQRTTDTSGMFEIGDLPIGYQLEIKIDDKQQVIQIQQGQGDIRIDATEFTVIEVKATLDGEPYTNAVAYVSYIGHNLQLTTDATGRATAKVPIDLNNGMCTISINNVYQQLPLIQPITEFSFDIASPKEEKITDVPTVDVKPDAEERIDVDEKKEDAKEEVPQNPKEEHPAPPVQEEKHEDNPVPQPEKKEKHMKTPLIWQIIAALALLLIVTGTYYVCYGMLFG